MPYKGAWLLRCKRLCQLPTSIGALPALKRLDLSGCTRLTTLPLTRSGLSALTRLDMSGCIRIASLPSEIGTLKVTCKQFASPPNAPCGV